MNRIVTCLLVLFALTGCLSEELSDCPDVAVRLDLAYYGDGQTDIFAEKISGSQIFVFDSDGRQVARRSVTGCTVSLDLQPSEYKYVIWGNAGRFSEIRQGSPLRVDHTLINPAAHLGEARDFDPLYYSQGTIDTRTGTTWTALFSSAHIDMELYVEGFSNQAGEPVLSAGGLHTAYDFDMKLLGDASGRVVPVTGRYDGGRLYGAVFNLLRFGEQNTVTVEISDGGDNVFHRFDLQRFMAENEITVTGINEAVVRIHIIFNGLEAEVRVADWDKNEVRPDL